MKSIVINVIVREDGTVSAKRAFGVEEIAYANLGLHTHPWQLEDLISAVHTDVYKAHRELAAS